MYGVVVTVCYAILGDRISENILFSLSGQTVEVVLVCILLHFLFAFNIVANPLMQRVEEALSVPNS